MPFDHGSAPVSRGIARPALLLLALTGSCNVHGSTAPDLPSEFPGHILIVSGMGRTDTTANVKLDFPFVVQLSASSAGHTVRFTALVGNQTVGQPFLLLNSVVGSENFTSGAFDVADAQGRARAQVRLAPVDGTALVEVAVPDGGVADTLSFTIAPEPR